MQFEKRLSRLDKKITELGSIDAFLVSNILNVRYLTGFTGSSGTCLLAGSERFFFTDGRYSIQAREEVSGWEIFDVPGKLDEVLDKFNFAELRVGIESESLTCSRYDALKTKFPGIGFVYTSSVVESLRAVKDREEIQGIKEAVAIAERAFLRWLPSLKPGSTEKSLAIKLESFMLEEGGDDLSFKAIIASGLRSAMPHATPTLKPLEEGDLVVIDFGLVYNGYCSDCTRSFVLGQPSREQEDIFDTVRQAQETVFERARAGMSCSEIDKLARDCIEAAGYGELFSHGTGHGVGLEVHELPVIGKNRDDVYVGEGTVFTVEPGIYKPGLGGVRIEDMVIVEEDGVEVLNSLPKNIYIDRS